MHFSTVLLVAAAALVAANPIADIDAAAATCAKRPNSCASLPCCEPTINYCNTAKKCVKIPGSPAKPGKPPGSGRGPGGASSPSSPSSGPSDSGNSPSNPISGPSPSSGGSSGGGSY